MGRGMAALKSGLRHLSRSATTPSHPTYDAIVVGMGGMGSAALYHLTQQSGGGRYLGLEQFKPGHNQGSSHGDSRIIRLAYAEDPSYVPLLHRAYDLWWDLERKSGQKLLHITGSIDGGLEHMFSFAGALRSAKEHGLDHEIMDGTEANKRFPGYNLPPNFKVLYQPQGGFLESESCIAAHVKLAQENGAEVAVDSPIKRWKVLSDGIVQIETEHNTYHTHKLVLTAGAWMPKLVPELTGCVPERQVIAWFDIEDDSKFSAKQFPVFNLEDETGRWYGFPNFHRPGFKIGKYGHANEVVTGDDVDRSVRDEDIDLLWSGAGTMFSGLTKKAHHAAACMFTNTPDEHFVLDLHPDASQVVLCSACSGHGYKFASVIGEILAELALKGETQHDISLHRINHASRKESLTVWESRPQVAHEE